MSGEPRSIEETERARIVERLGMFIRGAAFDHGYDVVRLTEDFDALLAERAALKTAFHDATFIARQQRVQLDAAESRIGSLVGERDGHRICEQNMDAEIARLREALAEIATLDRKTHHLLPALEIARSVLSSREASDPIQREHSENVALRAERDSLLSRVSELEDAADSHRALDTSTQLHTNFRVAAAESRIESLVGEREELREALEAIAATETGWRYFGGILRSFRCPTCGSNDRARQLEPCVHTYPMDTDAFHALAVLSSRETAPRNVETTDSEPNPNDFTFPAGMRGHAQGPTDSPTPSSSETESSLGVCPTCGSPDPKVRGNIMDEGEDYCTDTFHSTDRGKEP